MAQRILLVEDSPTQALRLRILLEAEGYIIEQADSADAALPMLNGILPHLLIVDHHLPGLQGGDLCRLIRLHVTTLSMPILMLTADETPARQREGLDSGADDFLPKSADPRLLLLRVRQLLRHADIDVLPQTQFRQPRALIVGFDAVAAGPLLALLTEEGCQVNSIADAAAAFHHLSGNGYDVALVAERLPDMTGLALCRECRLRSPAGPALILAHGGDADGPGAHDMLATGVDDLFTTGAPSPALRASTLR